LDALAAVSDENVEGVTGREVPLITEATLLRTGAEEARLTGGRGRGGCGGADVNGFSRHYGVCSHATVLVQTLSSDLLQRVHFAIY
jgi:hypothetical protein